MIKKIMRHISALGTGFFSLILIVFTYLNSQEHLSTELLLLLIFITVIGEGIKFFHRKHRPDFDPKKRFDYFWPINKFAEIDEQSFPSLHVARSAGLLVILGSYFSLFYVQLFLAILVLTIAVSRLYLKRHYIEDVAGGAILGLMAAVVVLFFI